MKLVAKYTLALGTAMAISLSVIAYVRIGYLRTSLIDDMRRDHSIIGNVLRDGIANVWRDVSDRDRATRETTQLIARANGSIGEDRFAWQVTPADDTQRIEGEQFVSRFAVTSNAKRVGTLVLRERLSDVDHAVHTDVELSALTIALIVVSCVVAAAALGGWLVGRPVARLVDHARRIGRRDLSTDLAVKSHDELGLLAVELGAASGALAEALAKRDAEAEARLRAVEQLRHSERLSTVGKLAAGIAHELGTPLSVVAGHAQMIAGGEVSGDATLASATAIDHEATRMGKIVRQLLDFARRKGPEGTSCDATVVARRCVDLLTVMAERSAVACDVAAVEPAPQTLIDEDSLQQILTNLAINAIQAMPTGGALHVAIDRDAGDWVRVDVSDTGTGLSDEVRAHLFEPFFTTKPPGDGTGLGLAVVHGIVDDHGGRVAVASSAGGTTFSVYLREAHV